MFDGDTRLFKIGVSRAPDRRLISLRCQGHRDLTLLGTWPVERNAYRVEKIIHRYFQEHRRTGEWFDLPGLYVVEDIAAAMDTIYYP